MSPYDDKDLGVSLLIYMAAILCGLALFVVPAYLANRPTVVPNSNAKIVRSMLAARHNDGSFPVAHLKEKAIVSPALLAALNAKAEEVRPARDRSTRTVQRRHAPRHTPTRRAYAEVAPRRPIGPFGLFFSLF